MEQTICFADVAQAKGGFMKGVCYIAWVLCLLLVFELSQVFAQPPGVKPPHRMGMRPWGGENRCPGAFELNLSPEQAKALDQFGQSYLQETRRLRMELLSKRLEFRELLTGPSVKEESIRAKAAELAELQSRLEEKVTDYLMKVRSLLTPDQLRLWCPEQDLFLFHRMMDRSPLMPHRVLPHREGTKKE